MVRLSGRMLRAYHRLNYMPVPSFQLELVQGHETTDWLRKLKFGLHYVAIGKELNVDGPEPASESIKTWLTRMWESPEVSKAGASLASIFPRAPAFGWQPLSVNATETLLEKGYVPITLRLGIGPLVNGCKIYPSGFNVMAMQWLIHALQQIEVRRCGATPHRPINTIEFRHLATVVFDEAAYQRSPLLMQIVDDFELAVNTQGLYTFCNLRGPFEHAPLKVRYSFMHDSYTITSPGREEYDEYIKTLWPQLIANGE